MSVTVPTHGQTPWSGPLNTVLNTLASGRFAPNDHGFLNWSSDPQYVVTSASPASGSIRMVKLPLLPLQYTITNLHCYIATAGVGLTAGQCFAGLYDGTGTRVGVTADQSASWTSSSVKTMALTAPYIATANVSLWVALLFNGTSVGFGTVASVGAFADMFNANLTTSTARFTLGPTAQTSLPASVTMASRTLSSQSQWVAVS